MLTSPFALLLLYVNLRPVIDARIYRLLRRHLPKPDRPDKLSLRVALESDLIDWTIPTLGKRSEEEIRRSNMTLTEDIVHELITVKNWVLSFFMPRPASDQEKSAGSDGYIQKRIEQLRLDLGLVQRPGNTEAAHDSRPVHTREETHIYPQPEAGPSGTAIPHQPRRGDEMEPNQILVDEEHRFAQSPLQIQEEYFSSVHPAAGAAAEPIEVLPGELSAARDLRSSRSNTLYSRSPSPASSPPTSPRVRASLIHQNSDVITMHLELLQSHSDRNSQPLTITPNILQQNEAQANSIDRTASDILDALLSSRRLSRDEARVQPVQQAQNIPAQAMPAPTIPAPAPTIPAPAPTIPAPAPTIPDRRPLSEILSSSEMATLAAAVNGAFVGPGEAVTGSPLRIQAPPLPPLLQPPQPPPPPQPPQAPIDSPASTLSHLHRQPFPARPKQPKNDESDHRITLLSSHPTDAFSFHLSSIITSILFYPLESFYLRHLAMTTLSSRSMLTILPIGITATTLGLRGDVRNPGAWFGGGTVSGMATYIGKMLLIVGCEAVVSAGAWGVGVGAAVLFGRRKFNWGYL
ncbi:hypothetical protein FQN57_000949 [Myotisia sp. PD_48]|nr:hypothetical protein FQN57_000949 [Myotisia sp. PD_48]